MRYADDFLLGLIGSQAEAVEIKQRLAEFLRDSLKLELSQDKTLVTHATTGTARFLNYDLTVQHRSDYVNRTTRWPGGARSVNGKIALRLPADVVRDYLHQYEVGGKPLRKLLLLHESDFTIVAHHGSIFRGSYNYYHPAQNVTWLHRVRYAMERSMLHTLASKHKTSTREIVRRYKVWTKLPEGVYAGYVVVVSRGGKPPLTARFGGEPVIRRPIATLNDRKPYLGPRLTRTERMRRLLHEECELCGAKCPVEGHHVRKLADLKRYGKMPPPGVQLMVARRRKTLYLCPSCHDAIHAGRMNIETAAE